MDPELTHDDAPAPRSARRAPAPRAEDEGGEPGQTDGTPDNTPARNDTARNDAPARNGASNDATRAPLTRELRARDTAPAARPTESRSARRTADLRGDPRMSDPRLGDPRLGDTRSVEATVPTNIYRARRPAVAALLVIPAVGVGILLVRALAIAGFGDPFHIGGVIASSLGLSALPLLVAGLYGLITGAAHGAEQWGFRVWARPPLAYLLVGIAFAVAAGLAIT